MKIYKDYNLGKQQVKAAFQVKKGVVLILLSEVISLEAFGAYSKVILDNGETIIVNGGLKGHEGDLESYDFVRIHESHIINVHHIKSYIKERNNGKVIMSNTNEYTVSRSRKNELIKFVEI